MELNIDQNTLIIFIGSGIILLGIIFIIFSVYFINSGQTISRIQTFVLKENPDLPQQDLITKSIQFSEPFIKRMIIPYLKKIITFLGKTTPAQTIKEVNRKLLLAGIYSIKAQQYYGIRLIIFSLSIIWFFIDLTRNSNLNNMLMNGALSILTFIFPILWLNMKSQKRQEDIKKSLADALDILATSTSAGLGFDQALLKVSEVFINSPSGQEFARVVTEIEIGVSRQEALRNFSERVQIPEISSFVAVIIQSEILGMSISDVLHTQAEQMRIQRQYWIKEIAQKLPVKMMFPLAFLILPALMAVLLGPMVPSIFELF